MVCRQAGFFSDPSLTCNSRFALASLLPLFARNTQNRSGWKENVKALCALWHEEIERWRNYALIYPFLIYGIIAWGNTYSTTLKLYILEKKAPHDIIFQNLMSTQVPYSKP